MIWKVNVRSFSLFCFLGVCVCAHVCLHACVCVCFDHGCSILPTPSVEKNDHLPFWLPCRLYQKSVDYISVGLFLDSILCSIDTSAITTLSWLLETYVKYFYQLEYVLHFVFKVGKAKVNFSCFRSCITK